jgi:hydrogenase maturation protein HypF
LVKGIVQAVGFRPFVYRLANALKLDGFVINTGGGVTIEAQGAQRQIQKFIRRIKQNPPPASRIENLKVNDIAVKKSRGFIIKSTQKTAPKTAIPADIAICEDCQKDISDPKNRRFRHPFANCTKCGPRFTIIKNLPYDRAQTTMAAFKMCPACKAEFQNPRNRRFHAQPNCCPVCGPRVTFIYKNTKITGGILPLEKAAENIKKGKIIAIKSIGGFHLACDALNKRALSRLRLRKSRPYKPLALMFGDIKTAKKYCHINAREEKLLKSPQAPIVMLKKRRNIPLISERLNTTGVMLPYTPLHKIIFDILGSGPLVMTSGNISGEPICIENGEAQVKLACVADGFLLHNRRIYNRMDDSVIFELNGKTHFLRRARGYAPAYIALPKPLLKPALALGADITNSFCLAKGNKLFLSQYIGDMDNAANRQYFKDTLSKMKKLLNINPKIFVRDLHPRYFGASYKLSALPAQHHLAHALSVAAEHNLRGEFLCFVFDGAGIGLDNTIWGGEFLIIRGNSWRRAGCFKPLRIIGGESANTDIWKCALSYMSAANVEVKTIKNILGGVNAKDIDAALISAKNNINSYIYSGVGRLFDAAAAILGIRLKTTYQAQAAMELESLAKNKSDNFYNFKIENKNNFITVDTAGIIRGLIKNRQNPQKASEEFHNTLSQVILQIALTQNIKTSALSGGVFQNKILLAAATGKLEKAGFKVYTNNAIPAGDGGIAVGQIYAKYRDFI